MPDVLTLFRETKLVPVLVIEDPTRAVKVAEALYAGGSGLACAEVTFRTRRAAEALRRIAEEAPELCVGAGTVLTTRQAVDARAAGASFIVAPGFNAAVADYCAGNGLPYFPGIATPTELEAAMARDLRVVKFFPAEPLGGLPYLRAIAAPYGTSMEYIPTGGITAANVGGYLAFPQVVACGGSWMAPAEWVDGGSYDRIRSAAQQAVAAVRDAETAEAEE